MNKEQNYINLYMLFLELFELDVTTEDGAKKYVELKKRIKLLIK